MNNFCHFLHDHLWAEISLLYWMDAERGKVTGFLHHFPYLVPRVPFGDLDHHPSAVIHSRIMKQCYLAPGQLVGVPETLLPGAQIPLRKTGFPASAWPSSSLAKAVVLQFAMSHREIGVSPRCY